MSTQIPEDIILEAQKQGGLKKYLTYAKLSGPGWLQGAITLGGGSLAGSLYLGVIAGFGLMWLQPLAMICGIIMLSAIAYVTLSVGKSPFRLVNTHVSPFLGWAWLIATIMANIVWSMPQFNLARAAIQQNLVPGVGSSAASTFIICLVLVVIAFAINVMYASEGKGVKAFDIIIKAMVGIIILSFFAAVLSLTFSGKLSWINVITNLIPDPSLLFKPAEGYMSLISHSTQPEWWMQKITNDQRDIIITAFGTAVGINMTWLLPYTLLKKRWGKIHRGLSIFDLSIGLFVPFFLATGCVVIAAATQFHGQSGDVDPALVAATLAQLQSAHEGTPNAVDQELALMLVKRDNFQLANSLEPFAGEVISQKIFGIGVLGMAISTIIILMLINGMAFKELFNMPDNKQVHLAGCAVSGLAGMAGPFIWKGAAAAALAVPTSLIGGSLIPIAYLTFFLLMNSRKVLGNNRPAGNARIVWNTLMVFATSIATFGSIWVLQGKAHFNSWQGIIPAAGLLLLVVLFTVGILSFLKNEKQT